MWPSKNINKNQCCLITCNPFWFILTIVKFLRAACATKSCVYQLEGKIMNSVASQSYSNQSMDQFSSEEAQGAHSSKPIDLVHLSRQTFGSKELENEVLGLFVSHSQQCLRRLKTAETNKEWQDILHTIKGSARAIGAWKTANIAENYEQKVGQLSSEEKTNALNDVQDEIKTTVSYIEGLI